MEEETTVRLHSGATIRKGSGSYHVNSAGSGRDDDSLHHPEKPVVPTQPLRVQRNNVMFAKKCIMSTNAHG